jgi:hypothetical protein
MPTPFNFIMLKCKRRGEERGRHMPTHFQFFLQHGVHEKIDTFLPCFQFVLFKGGECKGKVSYD